MDDIEKLKKKRENLTGYEEQEILIDMLAETIGKTAGMNTDSLKYDIRESLYDALEKRHLKFKDIKTQTAEEKKSFVNDIVINTVKRATLVEKVDEIIEECNKTYTKWKKKYRPGEID